MCVVVVQLSANPIKKELTHLPPGSLPCLLARRRRRRRLLAPVAMSIVADRSRPREEGRASFRSGAFPAGTPAERLTDDLLVEILTRVPAKSLCRCKCVSKHWLGLIRHPYHRKRLPQTLAGFFYAGSSTWGRGLKSPFHFTSLAGDLRPPFDTSFTFLPNHHPRVDLLDSCNGLLLCGWYHFSESDGVGDIHYVVCNPATEKWVALPNSGKVTGEVATTCLGFDPALSPHFHVFELAYKDKYGLSTELSGVSVYSSETGEWVYKEKGGNRDTWFATRHSSTVFLNGLLFFRAYDIDLHKFVVAVDTKVETWMQFSVPDGLVDDFDLVDGFIQRSQGRLHYAKFQRDESRVVIRLVVYVLEDYQSREWILKHSIETSNIFGWTDLCPYGDVDLMAIHPECNLVFFTARGSAFICYNMDNRQVKLISYLAGVKPLLPYVPLYTESQSLHI